MNAEAANMLGHYRVVRKLGAGGMGEVYLAQDTDLERLVALKIMSAELARDSEQRKRFRVEARAASSLNHPNICVIHEVGETDDGRPFLAMEYIEGKTVDEISRSRRLRPREVLRIGIGVAEALSAAHARGLVHRDIKPGNIMLDPEGRPKVLDFGLAKRIAQDELGAPSTSVRTRTGILIGTPHYMSPEQVLGRDLDPRSDLFSLGVVLYELLAGQRPFLGRTIGEVINNIVNQPPAALGLDNPVISPELDKVIFECLEKEPEKRPASAKALVERLSTLKDQLDAVTVATPKGGVPVVTTASSPATEGRTRLWQLAGKARSGKGLGLALAVVCVVVTLVAGFAFRGSLFGGRDTSLAQTNSPVPAAPAKSVAVLPFNNLTGEAELEYLCDGLTEEITTALSGLQGMKVAARNSAYSFKGRKGDVKQIGQTLRVRTLLEGSVRKSGNQIRVTAQLINVADGFNLWSENYDRSFEDVLKVQEDIAKRIAERLQSNANAASMRVRAVDPAAHRLYLQARLFWNKRTKAGLKRAQQLFEGALEKDPNFAGARAGLASTLMLLPLFSEERASLLYPRAAAEAQAALDLDASNAEAHAVLGTLLATDQKPKEAEQHFLRALQLGPNNPTAHQWYGRFLCAQARREEGLEQLKIAADLDPLSPVIQSTIPEWYYVGRKYDRAIQEARNVIETFNDFPLIRSILIASLAKKGDYAQALKEIDQARALQPDEPLVELEMKGYVLARSGQEPEARKILVELENARGRGRRVDGQMAVVHLGLREYDRALDRFEAAVTDEKPSDMLEDDPFFEEVASMPRFKAILEKARNKPPNV
jgi:TolB-like protein/Tfp pilus assembly protein PilF/predicted Ser/Thr protein kinase